MPATLPALLLVVLPVAAAAQAPQDVHAEVRALLGAIDTRVSPDAFRQLGPQGEAALADIALSSSDLPPHRARALEVLAALRSPRAEEVHRTVASSADAPVTARRAAVRGLGRLVAAERATAALSPFLREDRDPRVRAAAAEALAEAAPAQACGAIRAQVAREAGPGSGRFSRAVAACERQQAR